MWPVSSCQFLNDTNKLDALENEFELIFSPEDYNNIVLTLGSKNILLPPPPAHIENNYDFPYNVVFPELVK